VYAPTDRSSKSTEPSVVGTGTTVGVEGDTVDAELGAWVTVAACVGGGGVVGCGGAGWTAASRVPHAASMNINKPVTKSDRDAVRTCFSFHNADSFAVKTKAPKGRFQD
jgi:hypothetical protein